MWVGYLNPDLEDSISFSELDSSDARSHLGFLQDGREDPCLPFAEALVAISDEKFAFCSAVSQESASEERFRKLEESMAQISASLRERPIPLQDRL